jgi:DeoR/GlpR family transcriptional regulator of sugar metabolism
LTVITNSLLVVNTLVDRPMVTVIALGGLLRRSEFSFIGHITEQSLSEVRADRVFIGIHALSLEQGLTNDYLPETMTDRAILRNGREIVLVADHTKIGRVSTAFVAPLTGIHILVTDSLTPQEFITALTTQGIRVITC